ncbi:FIST N domain-containing protein [Desulfurobacterium pacificum]|uniref:FIST N domain-containing protein n=1 Tax=Desulfurobacterium pacificum TaxID=240166 RepID=A0ABY1NPR8_9BACT|nr:FIST C-terminal domain-containing protein [Desulfurobacterium pacificum]SMP14983.1 FIST N domain-containing protein [Desulfurobacterium pacificum]
MRTKVISSNNPVLQLALEEIEENLFQTPDFAMISVCPCYPYEDVPSCIESILGIENYVAFNAIDSFCNTKIMNKGVSGMFFFFERNASVEIFCCENLPSSNLEETIRETVSFLKEKSHNLNLIIGDYSSGVFPVFLCELGKQLKKENINAENICGGIVSTPIKNGRPESGYVFANGRVISEGFVIVSFSNLTFEIALSTGIFRRGPVYTVTSGSMFDIYELDGEPAHYLPERLLKNIENYKKEHLWYTPLAVLNEKEEITTVRTFKDFSPGKIEVWAPIEEGQKLKLAFVVPEEILKDTESSAKRVKAKLSCVEAIFNFSCVARQYTLEKKAELEPKIYAQILNAPLFGFFTHGEIAPSEGTLKLHNQTSVLVAMKEAL